MNGWASGLLAQSDPISRLGDRFEPGGYDLHAGQIYILIGILVGIGITVWVLTRYFARKEGQGFYSPKRLFRELCSAHELDWRDRRLLQQVVRLHRLSQPATLFVDPVLIDEAVGHGMFAQQRQHLEMLRSKVFD